MTEPADSRESEPVKKTKVQWMDELQRLSLTQLQERLDLKRAEGIRGWAVTAETKALKSLIAIRESAPDALGGEAEEVVPRSEFYSNIIYAIASRMGTSEFTIHNIKEVVSAVGQARWAYLLVMDHRPEAEEELERIEEIREALNRDESERRSRGGRRGGYNEHIVKKREPGPKTHAANTGAKTPIEQAFESLEVAG